MVIKSNWLVPSRFAAYTFLWVIFIRPEHAGDTALLAHEQAHVTAFWRNPLKVMLNWLVQSWQFDFELEGFRAQYAADPSVQSLNMLAFELSTNYGFGITQDQARRLITMPQPS